MTEVPSPRRSGLRSLLRLVLGAVVVAGVIMTAAVLLLASSCESNVAPYSSLPTAAGYRADGENLSLWTGAPCVGVTEVEVTFRVKVRESTTEPNYDYYELLLTAPSPGVRVEHLDLAEPGPAFTVGGDLPPGFDWRSAAEIVLTIHADGPTWTSRVAVDEIVTGSPQHPADTYLFDDLGWKNPTDVQRENGTDFLTICTPDPDA